MPPIHPMLQEADLAMSSLKGWRGREEGKCVWGRVRERAAREGGGRTRARREKIGSKWSMN